MRSTGRIATPAPTWSRPTPSAARPTCSASTAWPSARTRSRARARARRPRRAAAASSLARGGRGPRAGARLAREAAGDGFVVGAMGPGTRSISVTRNVTFDEVLAAYEVQARALADGGGDALLLQTRQGTLHGQGPP